jgi:hypothetical protein
VLRLALVLLVACDAGAREDVAKKAAAPAIMPTTPPPAPPPPLKPVVVPNPVPNPVTTEIPAQAIATLTGCWRHDAHETWTFRKNGAHGLDVVRELGDEMYADRARIPRPVNYDPTTKTFGFGAAGRIHGLMMLFQIDHAILKTDIYSSHTPGSYGWTGNRWTLKRC